ncbi:DUF1127 domain-containing protein [Litoreibacter halocynthiae]|uniref:DUF1127 domain-containing protein n=1 Tax=Litoreibacter halocynthiae TaxID=1242689 RepID=UPI0024912318|nr:DUF1127 domain-containing protein [Litoreibacter halocynthiae]
MTQHFNAAAMNANHPPKQGGFMRRWLRDANQSWKRRKMIAAFEAMDDFVLNDIGIHRSEIKRFVESLDSRELGMAPVAPASKAACDNLGDLRLVA